MMKKQYVIKTYFQEEDKKSFSFAEYYFQLVYNTIVPTGCALLALDTNNAYVRWFFIACFVVLAVSQFKVKTK